MITLPNNSQFDPAKGLYEQDAEVQEYLQNLIDTTEPQTTTDEYNRPVDVVWENGKIRLTQTTTYRYPGTHPASWTPQKSVFTVEIL